MKFSKQIPYAAIAIACSLSACSGSQSGSSPLTPPPNAHLAAAPLRGLTPLDLLPSGVPRSAAAYDSIDKRLKSRVSPNFPAQALFESDFNSQVFIFRLPDLKASGQICCFNKPTGLCSDASGHVWVTEFNGAYVDEFSHNAHWVKSLALNSTAQPEGCAVNPVNGDLAVTAFANNGNPGYVLIYPHAQGSPTAYSDPNLQNYFFAGYDPSGNLFVDGLARPYEHFVLSELNARRRIGEGMHTITLAGATILYPGMVQWYTKGNTLVVGDQFCNPPCVESFTIAGSVASYVSSTVLNGFGADELVQGVISETGDYLVGGIFAEGVYLWPYPGGGDYTSGPASLDTAYGAAISVKNH